MKLEKYFLLLALGVFAFALQSCDDDDNDGISVPAELSNALAKEHPNAQRIEWETKGAYYVADFHEDNFEKEAWFTKDGVWQMTETDLRYADLPAPVRSSYESSTYYNVWKVEDVDKLERKEMAVVYIIEVEKEMDLYYSEDGVLLREVPDRDGNDDHGDMLPQELSKAISDFIARKYPGARIVDAEREKGNTEVDIIFAGKALEVCFGTGDAWLWTKTGVRLSEVPDVVRRTLQSSQYGTWVIDDVDLYESPDRVWYAIEVEDPQSEREATVRILEDGTLL